MGMRGREEKTFIFDGVIPPRRGVLARQATRVTVGTAFSFSKVVDCPFMRFFLTTSTRILMLMQWPVDPLAFRNEYWIRQVFLTGQYTAYNMPAPMNQTGYLLVPYSIVRIQLQSMSIQPATVQFEAHFASN
jgi:hypothetical protein